VEERTFLKAGGGGYFGGGGGAGGPKRDKPREINKYQGVKINRTDRWTNLIGHGHFDKKSSTLFVPANAPESYTEHEYGHYLQLSQLGEEKYNIIESESF
jgi:hypothetical protein